MKTIGYIRVSTAAQATEGVSLDAQAAKIRAYCDLNDLELIEIVSDAGLSAKTANRAGLQRVLSAADAGDVAAVVVFKLDRLSRKTSDTLAIIERLEAAGVAFHSITEKVDTRSAMGRFFMTITAAFAEMERDLIAERTSAALQHKIAQGEHVGGIPFGYKLEQGRLVLEYSQLISDIRALRAAGMTLQGICDRLSAEGIKTLKGGTWRPCTIKKILERAA
jgi:site-specific DNA recombinase